MVVEPLDCSFVFLTSVFYNPNDNVCTFPRSVCNKFSEENNILNENSEVIGEVADVFIDENALYFMAVIKLTYDKNDNIIPLQTLYINNQIFYIETQKNYVL